MVRERESYHLCVHFFRENSGIKVIIPAPFILLVITPLELVLLFFCVTMSIIEISDLQSSGKFYRIERY